MSYLVLHMDKFKAEAVRGIQCHNNRERESHSNPDIVYERSGQNYELHENAAPNYAEAIQNRIDDLLLDSVDARFTFQRKRHILQKQMKFRGIFNGKFTAQTRYF